MGHVESDIVSEIGDSSLIFMLIACVQRRKLAVGSQTKRALPESAPSRQIHTISQKPSIPLAYHHSIPSDKDWDTKRQSEIVYRTSSPTFTVATRHTAQKSDITSVQISKLTIEEIYYGESVPEFLQSTVREWATCEDDQWQGQLAAAIKCIARDIKKRCEGNRCRYSL
ncbi:hypothetical protein EIP86_006203 [Pleurotus ostreatoroseus]|nr:hypothetical protein EIP86_006203 [Pleurotus ostreatoroseus]